MPAPLQVDNLWLDPGEPRSRITLSIGPGEGLLVTGDNGSGKSALLARLVSPDAEDDEGVEFFGLNPRLRRERPKALSRIGVLFERSGLLRNRTVAENVALPLIVSGAEGSRSIEEHVENRLALVGCARLKDAFPDQISEGDSRCVALARALSGNTRMLLADEPVIGLSPPRRRRIVDLINGLLKCRALDAVVVFTQETESRDFAFTHRLELSSDGNSFGINRGQIANNAPPALFHPGEPPP